MCEKRPKPALNQGVRESSSRAGKAGQDLERAQRSRTDRKVRKEPFPPIKPPFLARNDQKDPLWDIPEDHPNHLKPSVQTCHPDRTHDRQLGAVGPHGVPRRRREAYIRGGEGISWVGGRAYQGGYTPLFSPFWEARMGYFSPFLPVLGG